MKKVLLGLVLCLGFYGRGFSTDTPILIPMDGNGNKVSVMFGNNGKAINVDDSGNIGASLKISKIEISTITANCIEFLNDGSVMSSALATINALNATLSSFTVIENQYLLKSSGTETERLFNLTLASFTINDGNVASKIASSVVLSSFTGIEASINTKVSYDIFYGSMTTIESQKNTIAGNVFVVTTASSPATVDSPTAIGNIRWGQDVSDGKWYLYVSTATNSWSRTELTW